MSIPGPWALDADPFVLGLRNGVLCVTDGTFSEAQPDMLLSRQMGCEYDPDAPCPMFLETISQIMEDDLEMIGLLQRSLGLCLTGDVSHEVLFFWHGSGSNGKSMLSAVVESLFGDYVDTIDAEALEKGKHDTEAKHDLSVLSGVRLALAKETSSGGIWNDRLLKLLASVDTIRARVIYGKKFTYRPTAKLLIHGNHKPGVLDSSDGLWRRLVLVSFKRTFTEIEKDRTLGARIVKNELSGVLNWILEGYRLVLAEGRLLLPKKVEAERTRYREDSDILGQWIDECTILDPTKRTVRSELYRSYSTVVVDQGMRAPASATFYRKLEEAQPQLRQSKSGVIWFYGIEIRKSAVSYEDDFPATDE